MKAQRNRGWRWAGSVFLFLLILLATAIAVLTWIRRKQADPVAYDAELAPAIERAVVRARAAARPVAGAMSGRVVDWAGRGVDGAAVAALRQRVSREAAAVARATTSAGGGEFRFDDLAPGIYVVTATAPGFTRAFRDRLEVEPGSTLEDVRLRLWAGGITLSGRVLDAGGGVIPGAHVRATGYDQTDDGTHEARAFQTEADGEGQYRLQLPKGRHRLFAGADGYAEATESRELSADTSKDFLLQPAAHIAGRVVTSDGQPVPGARVRAHRGEGWRDVLGEPVTTDDLGRFLVGPLSPGGYRLTAAKEGLLGSTPEPISVESAARIEGVELMVAATVTVRGRVRAVSGPLLPHARVNLIPQARALRLAGPPPGAFADENGRYQIGDVVPGDYRLTVAAPDHARHSTALTILGSLEHDIVLAPAAVITGVVLTAAGQPAARASVQAFVRPSGAPTAAAATMSHATTDPQGRFSLTGLGGGQLTVNARHQFEAGSAGPDLLDSAGRKELTIRLAPGARINGTVTWTDGTPIAAATVMTIAAFHDEYRSFRIETRTAADGTFTLAGLPPGPISLRAAAPRTHPADALRAGPGPEQITVTLTTGESRTGVKLLVARQ